MIIYIELSLRRFMPILLRTGKGQNKYQMGAKWQGAKREVAKWEYTI
jgi:hypothetical protein